MTEADYYPAGAYEDPEAPYNKEEVPDRVFNVFISQTLSKSTMLTTDDYRVEPEDDEDGFREIVNTKETDWKEAYNKEHLTPYEIIEEAKKWFSVIRGDCHTSPATKQKMSYLIRECNDWIIDDIEVMED